MCGDGLVERPRVVRGDRGGDLDGDVVDVVAREQPVGALEAAGGLLLAEDGLAEQVDVEADAVLADLRDGAARAWRRWRRRSGGRPSRAARGGRSGMTTPGRTGASAPPSAHGRAACTRAGRTGPSARGSSRLRAATREVLGADDAVDEADREVQAVGVLQHAGELRGRGVDRDLGRLGEPAADQGDGLVGEVLGTGGVRRCGVGGRSEASRYTALDSLEACGSWQQGRLPHGGAGLTSVSAAVRIRKSNESRSDNSDNLNA